MGGLYPQEPTTVRARWLAGRFRGVELVREAVQEVRSACVREKLGVEVSS